MSHENQLSLPGGMDLPSSLYDSPERPLRSKKNRAYGREGYSRGLQQASAASSLFNNWEIHTDRSLSITATELPNPIRCAICKEFRRHEEYSKTQLNFLKQEAYVNGPGSMYDQRIAKCRTCAHSTIDELHCSSCGHWKAVDEFSNTQRRVQHHICKRCQNWYQHPSTVDDSIGHRNALEEGARLQLDRNMEEASTSNLTGGGNSDEIFDGLPPPTKKTPWLDDEGRPLMVKGLNGLEDIPVRHPTRDIRHLYRPDTLKQSRKFGAVVRPARTHPEEQELPLPPQTPPPVDPDEELPPHLNKATWEYL
ncbi:hypothetical protein N7488_009715 [Penicillium malachiteum]|nr:hypothetical protein N7488_009715 [Penicillium malachiteum]